jgi:hypothetical protein
MQSYTRVGMIESKNRQKNSKISNTFFLLKSITVTNSYSEHNIYNEKLYLSAKL